MPTSADICRAVASRESTNTQALTVFFALPQSLVVPSLLPVVELIAPGSDGIGITELKPELLLTLRDPKQQISSLGADTVRYWTILERISPCHLLRNKRCSPIYLYCWLGRAASSSLACQLQHLIPFSFWSRFAPWVPSTSNLPRPVDVAPPASTIRVSTNRVSVHNQHRNLFVHAVIGMDLWNLGRRVSSFLLIEPYPPFISPAFGVA